MNKQTMIATFAFALLGSSTTQALPFIDAIGICEYVYYENDPYADVFLRPKGLEEPIFLVACNN